MADDTPIPYVHHTFNPWWGCQRVSDGCSRCYAEMVANRWFTTNYFGALTPRKPASHATWAGPRNWNAKAKAAGDIRRVLCLSMGDVFDPHPDCARARVLLLNLIRETKSLRWLLLTKRPEQLHTDATGLCRILANEENVWFGVTVEKLHLFQRTYCFTAGDLDHRRVWVSYEPALTPLPLDSLHNPAWVVAGCESGPKRRPAEDYWFAQIRDDCASAGVPFYLKQMDVNGRVVHTPGLDGVPCVQIPADLLTLEEKAAHQ